MLELRVHRWQHRLDAPRGWSAAQGQTAAAGLQRHTEAIARQLANALEGELGDDDSVLLLPELRIDARFDPRADWHAACGQWARQLARQLLQALHDPASGAVRFPSRAHHAARYLLARARGTAAGSWWWRNFDGVAVLPVSQALRTVLAESAPQGFSMLASLDEGEARQIAEALGDAEAWRLALQWCEQLEEQAPQEAAAAGGSWAGLAAALTRHAAAAPTAQALMLLRQRCIEQQPASVRAADVVHAFAAALFVSAAAQQQPAGAGAARESADPWTAPPHFAARELLARLDDAARRRLQRQALAAAAGPPATAGMLAQPAPFGGAAWLLYAVQDLLAQSGSWPWPTGAPGCPVGLMSLMVASAAMPPSRALGLWRDSAWRLALDVHTQLDLAQLHAYLCDAESVAHAWAEVWPRWLAGVSRDACVLRLRTGPGDRPVPWAVDRTSGLWLTSDAALALPEAAAPDFRTRLALTRAVRAESAFLGANEFTQRLPPLWQPLVLHAAQAALRRLAVRIPGMAWSSANHLHANVLGVRGTLVPPSGAGQAWALQLERAPLDVLLAMTGLVRASWPLLPGRRLALQRAEGSAQ